MPEANSRGAAALKGVCPPERLWELARRATSSGELARASADPSNELLEAAAALQDLACRFAVAADPAPLAIGWRS